MEERLQKLISACGLASRRAAEGWRYAGWIPTQQINGGITELDLIFEREDKP